MALCNFTKLTKPECHWIGLRILIMFPRTGNQVFLSLYFPYYSSYEAVQFFFFFWLYGLHLEDNAEFYTVPHYTQVIFKGITAHCLLWNTNNIDSIFVQQALKTVAGVSNLCSLWKWMWVFVLFATLPFQGLLNPVHVFLWIKKDNKT